VRVTVVCSGNICRSPMAEVVLRDAIAGTDLVGVTVDSAGTGDWHVGDGADPRALATLADHGLDGSAHRARQFTPAWFGPAPHLVLAADRGHLRVLRRLPGSEAVTIRLLRSFDPALAGLIEDDPSLDLPDPYFDGSFEPVLTMLRHAAPGIVAQLRGMS
jgi:protein-tyrosine phosphatase